MNNSLQKYYFKKMKRAKKVALRNEKAYRENAKLFYSNAITRLHARMWIIPMLRKKLIGIDPQLSCVKDESETMIEIPELKFKVIMNKETNKFIIDAPLTKKYFRTSFYINDDGIIDRIETILVGLWNQYIQEQRAQDSDGRSYKGYYLRYKPTNSLKYLLIIDTEYFYNKELNAIIGKVFETNPDGYDPKIDYGFYYRKGDCLHTTMSDRERLYTPHTNDIFGLHASMMMLEDLVDTFYENNNKENPIFKSIKSCYELIPVTITSTSDYDTWCNLNYSYEDKECEF